MHKPLKPLLIALLACGMSGCDEQAQHTHAGSGKIDWSKPHIVVEPEVTRAIGGVSEMERKRYFAVCDHGTGFDNRMAAGEGVYDYLVNDLGIYFGRQLGPVKYTASQLPEDPDRPGYADISSLEKQEINPPGETFYKDFGPNLDVAAHGNHNAYPEYMGKYMLEGTEYHGHEEWIPDNIDAAAELAAAVFKYNYNDFDRPKYFEPLNEPHWKFFVDQHMADWHLAVKSKIQETMPEVLVGGMCQSVSYFFRSNYQNFVGLEGFIKNTEGKMDFYSFHSYDYFYWEDNSLNGRIQSGLPLEGSLDLLQNHTVNTHGREVDVVISEQGGYINVNPKGEYDGERVASYFAEKYFPDKSWENELRKRSIVCFVHVSSIIANTLAFMDHPHTVQKSVPFLLPNTWNWDPKYYANLYVPENYTDQSKWVPTHMLDFYKLFRGVDGRRVKTISSDPDLQARAFVNGSKLYLLVNNLSSRPESTSLWGINAPKIDIRRFGRNEDQTAYYNEETIKTPSSLELAGRETVVMIADLSAPIREHRSVNEISCYGDKTRVPLSNAEFTIRTPVNKPMEYAVLRVALTRPNGMSYEPKITLNGKELDVPLEDCADRLERGEYGSTKLIYIDPDDLRAKNRVKISFDDGDEGVVGTVVIRVAVKQ